MRKIIAALAAALMMAPLVVFAFPFGGEVGQVIFCYNDAIWAAIGPPVAGDYVWTPSTVTYEFGPPTHSGQWLLGLASPPYYCLVSIEPIIVYTGVAITMMGSSQ